MTASVSEKSQGEIAYARMLDAIRAGHFLPGDRIREADVAARLDLSRTPVREALRRLEADGVVEHRPRLGAVIRQLGQAELVELYEMRGVLERTASEMAAKHAADAEIDALEDINAAIADAHGDPSRAAALNQDFHRMIYHATRNRFLLHSARSLNNALLLLGPTTLADAERIAEVVHQHQDILNAVRARDVSAAGAAAQTHLATSLRHRLRTLAT